MRPRSETTLTRYLPIIISQQNLPTAASGSFLLSDVMHFDSHKSEGFAKPVSQAFRERPPRGGRVLALGSASNRSL